MAQRAEYILRKRNTSSSLEEAVLSALGVAEATLAEFVRDVYKRGSISTHTHAGREEAQKIHSLALIVLLDLLGK